MGKRVREYPEHESAKSSGATSRAVARATPSTDLLIVNS